MATNDNSLKASYLALSEIPQEAMELYREAQHLEFNHNEFLYIPPSISLFKNVTVLDFGYNKIKIISKEITELVNLKILQMRCNHLSESSFPKEFQELSELEVLNVCNNRLLEIPYQFFELRKLKYLQLGGNLIREVPKAIEQLSDLEILYLGGNRLSEIPSEIGNLNNLTSLILSDNHLFSIPDSLNKLTKLLSLSLHNNNLRVLPQSIVKLENLEELSLRSNPLVAKFIKEMDHEIPSLLELAARYMLNYNIPYNSNEIPSSLKKYLSTSHKCVNPECNGVYFTARCEQIKFVDFCGKYKLPLLQYLCSPQCQVFTSAESSTESEEDIVIPPNQLRRVLLG